MISRAQSAFYCQEIATWSRRDVHKDVCLDHKSVWSMKIHDWVQVKRITFGCSSIFFFAPIRFKFDMKPSVTHHTSSFIKMISQRGFCNTSFVFEYYKFNAKQYNYICVYKKKKFPARFIYVCFRKTWSNLYCLAFFLRNFSMAFFFWKLARELRYSFTSKDPVINLHLWPPAI